MTTNLNNQPFYNIPNFREFDLSQLDLTPNTEEYPNIDRIYQQSLDLLYYCSLQYKHRYSSKLHNIDNFKNAAIHNIAKYNIHKSPKWLLSQIKSKQTLLPSDKIGADKAQEVKNQEFDWTSLNEFFIQNMTTKKSKSDLPALYMTSGCGRPRTTNLSGQHINQYYNNWTGFYPIDLDLKHLFPNCKKNKKEMDKAIKFTESCVEFLHENLKYQPWYMLTKRSHSKIGIHVFTMVQPTILPEDNNDLDNSLDVEILGAKMKKSFIQTTMHHNYIIYQLLKQFGIDENKLNDNGAIIDGMMLKISQLIKVSVDTNTQYGHALKQLPVDQILNIFPPTVDPISIKEIEQIPFFQKLYSDWLGNGKGNNSRIQKKINTDFDEQYIPSYTIDGNNPEDIKPIDFSHMNKGDKFKARISVINALHFLFDGKRKKMRPFFNAFFKNDITESNAFYASSRAVAPMSHTRRLMTEHGFKFNTSDQDKVLIAEHEMKRFGDMQRFKNLEPLNIKTKPTIINLDGDKFKYVSDKKDQLLSALKTYQLNLIESAPGTGKTEFFKTLAKDSSTDKNNGKRVLLAMPYTSVIKNKVEHEKFGAVCYGEMKLEDAMSKSTFVTCTFDKLGNIFTNQVDRLLSNFDYVVVDESQIQFDSDFRNQVMGKLIENIVTSVKKAPNDFLFQEDTTKFVWMTGTTLFEHQYLETHQILNYIKIEKVHPFKKEITQKFTPYSEFIPLLIATEIKDAFLNDEKIMVPINEGDLQIHKIIEYASVMLGKELRYNIFKKANVNDKHVIDVLESGIFPNDCDVLFATNYCSVGIDIKASYNARILVNGEKFTPQQIEQFCNRFRSNDIKCSVYYGALIKDENDIPEIKSRLLNQDSFPIPEITTDDVYQLATELVVNKYRETCQGEDITTNKFYSMMMVKKNNTWVPSSYMMELVLLQNKFTKYSQSSIYHKGKFLEYGYTVGQEIINHEGIIDQYEKMKEHNKEVSRKIKRERTQKYVEFMELLLLDETKTKDSDIVRSNNLVRFKEDITGEVETIIKGYDELNHQVNKVIFNKKYRDVYEEAKSDAFKLGKNYSGATAIRLINELINENDVIKKADKNNTINLVKMFKIEKDGSISPASLKFIKVVRDMFCSDNTSGEEIIIPLADYQQLMNDIQTITINQFQRSINTTVDNEVLDNFRNEYLLLSNEEIKRQAINDQRIQKQIQNNINALCKVRKKGEEYKMQLRTIPAFDNNQYLNAIDADAIMEALFGKGPEQLKRN